MKKKTFSWKYVIVLTIFIWPIGLYFLVKKLITDKTAAIKGTTAFKYVGIGLFIFGLLGTLVSLTGQLTQTVNGQEAPATLEYTILSTCLILIFMVGGVVVWIKANKFSRQGILFKQYINMIINSHITSIKDISSKMRKQVDDVCIDLEIMIQRDIFQGANIDYSNYQIVLTELNTNSLTDKPIKRKNITCSSCGAQNEVIIKKESRCEYCGTILK